jgi:hypothetical protein
MSPQTTAQENDPEFVDEDAETLEYETSQQDEATPRKNTRKAKSVLPDLSTGVPLGTRVAQEEWKKLKALEKHYGVERAQDALRLAIYDAYDYVMGVAPEEQPQNYADTTERPALFPPSGHAVHVWVTPREMPALERLREHYGCRTFPGMYCRVVADALVRLKDDEAKDQDDDNDNGRSDTAAHQARLELRDYPK